MGWTDMNEEKYNKYNNDNKTKMDLSSKILLCIIMCLVLIIILIAVMLVNIQNNTIILSINGKDNADYDINKLVSNIEDTVYINIQEFAKLVGYEYHKGEYKSFLNEEDKCYVTGKNETATFYLNNNIINKLPLESDLLQDYNEHTVPNTAKLINNKMYATEEAIEIAFNVSISISNNSLTIITLDYLLQIDNANVVKWGYTDIINQNSFENQKALLYDRIIVKKKDGMYKIIDRNNTQEIVPDKYSDIQFLESEQQFLITNSLGKIGILDLNGNIEIEPIYNGISLLDKKQKLYIVEKNAKYGVLKSGNTEIITPKYDDIGCNITTVEINGTKKVVNTVLTIEECNGIVVKKDDKYGVIDFKDNIIVPIQVDSIYSLKNEKNELEYFMIYNGEELNIIKMLVEQGIIEDPKTKVNTQEDKENTNTIENVNNTITTNSQNKITNTTES